MKNTKLSLLILMSSLLMIFSFDSYATRYSIDVRNYEFSPSNLLSVKIGDTIHWEWKDGSHTTTSTTIPFGAATWDSPIDASHLTFNYIPTMAGVYHYKCTPHASSGMVAQFTVLNESGISENLIPKITIYPNPFSDRIFFKSSTPEGLFIQHLTIYDIGGKVLREASFKDWSTFPEYLDVSNLPGGLIEFEFIDNLNRSYIRKAIRKE